MKSILIIEDNTELLDGCSEILELSGYQVLKASDGHKGVNIAINEMPDIILCDIMMPSLDGYGVFAILANNAATAKIPFIFLTAKADYADMRRAMELGADDYLTKPIDPNQLIKAIQARLYKATKQHSQSLSGDQQQAAQARIAKGMDQLQKIALQGRQRVIKKKQTLFYEGDPIQGIYLLEEGHVKTFRLTRDGRQLITGLYHPGDYIGLDALLLDEPSGESAEALEDSKCYLLPKQLVVQVLDEYPPLAQHFIKMLSRNIHEKEEQLIEAAYESVRKRMAQLLVRLSQRVDLERFNISREEMAGIAGIATETVSRVLSDFKEEGLIEKNSNQVKILDIKRLQIMKS